jgi:hypothetical protein
MKAEKWIIQKVKVMENEVAKIDFRLPAAVEACTGIAFTITDIEGAFNQLYPFGELSLSFNYNASHPLHFHTEFQENGYRMDCILIRLEEPLVGGSRITGYYRNLINPHLLRIYLQCIAEIN